MPLTLDPAALQELIRINRDSIDMNIPMCDEFKLHFMTQRRQILTNYRHQATGIDMMLSAVVQDPAAGVDPGLAACRGLLDEYREWVLAELAKLDSLRDAP